MGLIHVLDDIVASQIAAGEVVDRPSSVAKELVENALDAGARHVAVHLEGAGADRICVIDDGRGMDAADALLCFSRHATSKLSQASELKSLTTHGFRGEALAAIASVSRVDLSTRQEGDDQAQRVVAEGGVVCPQGYAAAPLGTRIDVRDLFFNVPARKAFLKTDATERRRIEHAVRAQALAAPHVAFSFFVDEREVFRVDALDADAPLESDAALARATSLLGPDTRGALFVAQAESSRMTLHAYVASPDLARRDSRRVFISVSGRPVQDRTLLSTVRAAFRPLMDARRFPQIVLRLEMDPAAVDVNVHPQKAEVRFSDARGVQGDIIATLSDFCAAAPWSRSGEARRRVFRLQRGEAAPVHAGDDNLPGDERSLRIQNALKHFERRMHGRGRGGGLFSEHPASDASSAPTSSGDDVTVPTLVGTARARLVVASCPRRGLLVVDGPRFFTARLLRRLERGREDETLAQTSRPLMFPLRERVDGALAARIADARPRFMALGFDVERFGQAEIVLRALPAGVPADTADAILSLLCAPPADDDALLRRVAELGAPESLGADDVTRIMAAIVGGDVPGLLSATSWSDLGLSELVRAPIVSTPA